MHVLGTVLGVCTHRLNTLLMHEGGGVFGVYMQPNFSSYSWSGHCPGVYMKPDDSSHACVSIVLGVHVQRDGTCKLMCWALSLVCEHTI